ncbi:uncharacterized protein LOC143216569 isoform X2 [Lasioglossum baleicum]
MEKEQLVPLPLSGTGDLSQNWQKWKDTFFLYLTANNYIKTSEDLKIRKLKEVIGPLGIYFIDTVRKDYNESELNNLQKLFAKLDIVFKVPPSEVEARYNFFTCSREKDESINKYIERLKEKAKTCNFGTMMDNLIRDKVITNIKDEDLLLTLFKMKFLDLADLIKICWNYEMAWQKNRGKTKKAEQVEKAKIAEQVEKVKIAEQVEKAKRAVEKAKKAEQVEKAKTAEQVEKAKRAVEKSKKAEQVDKAKKAERVEKAKKLDGSDINKTASQNEQAQPIRIFNRNCWRCNQKHPVRNCPAFGYKCEKCGDRNHFTHCCNMKIPNVEEKKPPFEIPNNTRAAYDFSHNTPPNMNPSAPPAFEVDNTLYPNLNYLRGSRTQM